MRQTWARSADNKGSRFVYIIRAGKGMSYRLDKLPGTGTYHLFREELLPERGLQFCYLKQFFSLRDAREWLVDLQG